MLCTELRRSRTLSDNLGSRGYRTLEASAIADEDLDRSTDTKTSAVHFMRFEMTDEMADALKNDADWMIGVQHPVYIYEFRVEGATRESLPNDLH